MRCPRPEARSRRTEKPQVERRVANVPRKGTSTPQGVGPLVAPHGAPFPRNGRGTKEDGPPRGLDKEYGWRSVGCLTIESVRDGESVHHTPLIPAQAGIQHWVPAGACTRAGEAGPGCGDERRIGNIARDRQMVRCDKRPTGREAPL